MTLMGHHVSFTSSPYDALLYIEQYAPDQMPSEASDK